MSHEHDHSSIFKKSLEGLKHFLQEKERMVLGRAEHTDLVNDHPSVSREHAEITKENGEYYVRNLSSGNTFLNGKKVKGKTKITEHDTLYIGMHAYKLNEAPRDIREHHAIHATGVEKVYPNGFVGLHKVSVSIPNNEFVAMMGPSGCGKSTLLKVLNNDSPATSGSVKIFGLDLRDHYQMLKRKIGYVPQDDIVHADLTVDKSLWYAAKLRLPDDTSDAEIKQRIDEVLASLNVSPNIRTHMVRELSGGERKRISIAVELLNKPAILFLDEPTSPLDPETVGEFLKCLKGLNAAGTTIVMVTHKPDDLQVADKVIFMAGKGYHVYYGNTDELLPYFDQPKIIDVYSALHSEDSAKEHYTKWYSEGHEDNGEEQEQTMQRDKHESPIRQYYWLSRRYLNIKLNDRYNLGLLFAQPILIGGLVCFIFNHYSLGILFLMALSAVWFGVSNAAKEMVSETPIYRRERMYNMGIGTYVMSKVTVLSLIALVQTLIFASIIYLRYTGSTYHLSGYWQYVGFMFYLSVSSTLLGLLLSSIFDTSEKVMTVVPIILMPQVMLSGVVTKLDSVQKEVLSYLTLGRWGTQGFATIQDYQYAISDTTGSVLQRMPKIAMITDTTEDLLNTYIIVHPQIAKGDTLKAVGAMKTLAYYDPNREGMLHLFQTLPENLMVITAMNVLMVVGIYFFLRKRDAQ